MLGGWCFFFFTNNTIYIFIWLHSRCRRRYHWSMLCLLGIKNMKNVSSSSSLSWSFLLVLILIIIIVLILILSLDHDRGLALRRLPALALTLALELIGGLVIAQLHKVLLNVGERWWFHFICLTMTTLARSSASTPSSFPSCRRYQLCQATSASRSSAWSSPWCYWTPWNHSMQNVHCTWPYVTDVFVSYYDLIPYRK